MVVSRTAEQLRPSLSTFREDLLPMITIHEMTKSHISHNRIVSVNLFSESFRFSARPKDPEVRTYKCAFPEKNVQFIFVLKQKSPEDVIEFVFWGKIGQNLAGLIGL